MHRTSLDALRPLLRNNLSGPLGALVSCGTRVIAVYSSHAAGLLPESLGDPSQGFDEAGARIDLGP